MAAAELREALAQRLRDLGIATVTTEHPQVGAAATSPRGPWRRPSPCRRGCGGSVQPRCLLASSGPFLNPEMRTDEPDGTGYTAVLGPVLSGATAHPLLHHEVDSIHDAFQTSHSQLKVHKPQHSKVSVVEPQKGVVFTVEEMMPHVQHMKGGHSKNLFLKDKKKKGFWLVTVLHNRQINLNDLAKKLGVGSGNLRFADENAMLEKLKVGQGCATPLALFCDSGDVRFVLDAGFLEGGHEKEETNFATLQKTHIYHQDPPDAQNYLSIVLLLGPWTAPVCNWEHPSQLPENEYTKKVFVALHFSTSSPIPDGIQKAEQSYNSIMQDMQALRLQCIDDIERRDGLVVIHNAHTTITTGEPQLDLLKMKGMGRRKEGKKRGRLPSYWDSASDKKRKEGKICFSSGSSSERKEKFP
ncbi:hypothetical protein QYF61_003181 [Mycteria americana]|uniref:PrdX deacylase domain-containing protein 1 n=1 Tax=Mycteria americana TaxID=33587 RepID=A0AAN7RWV2_MYCAM|nr:hypothetical protein QYF61_003181 [Mycteria americana]